MHGGQVVSTASAFFVGVCVVVVVVIIGALVGVVSSSKSVKSSE